jgi:hypothetical protein
MELSKPGGNAMTDGIPDGLNQKSGTAWLASVVVPVVEFQHLANAVRWLRQGQFLSGCRADAAFDQFAFQILWVDGGLNQGRRGFCGSDR